MSQSLWHGYYCKVISWRRNICCTEHVRLIGRIVMLDHLKRDLYSTSKDDILSYLSHLCPQFWHISELNLPAAQQLLPVEVVASVVGVAVVLELDEPVAVLERDLAEAAVALEELLDVALAHVVADVADVAARGWHGDDTALWRNLRRYLGRLILVTRRF